DHDAERIRMLLKLVADLQIAEFRGVTIPSDGVTPGPVAVRRGTDIERHANTVPGVEARTSYLRGIPAGSQVAGAPLRVGLEAAAREDHRPGVDRLGPLAWAFREDTFDGRAVEDELGCATLVTNLDALLAADLTEAVDQARPAAAYLHRQPAPELELAVDLERLTAEDRHEAKALLAHPDQSALGAAHQQLDEVRIAAVVRHSEHVVEELLFRVGAEVGHGDLGRGEV